jgi:hypothetical protein
LRSFAAVERLKAISVRQPWAHAIVHAGKDIENRGRAIGHRGLIFIHASAGMTDLEYDEALGFMGRRGLLGDWAAGMAEGEMERGGIIGCAEVVDCVRDSSSPWWMGPVGLILANARPLPFARCQGTVAPLVWTVPEAVEERLRGHAGFPA